MSQMEIRSFRESDRASLISLWQRCDLTRPWNDPDRDVDRRVLHGESGNEGILLAFGEGSLIGAVMFGYDGHRGSVNYLCVDPEHRRSGLAGVLMQAVEEKLRAQGCPKINLMVRTGNLSVRDFYHAIGYEDQEVVVLGKRLIED
ncbi:GNAT family acetyltransferase [Kiloniella sp. b19]|uniref:GNAT family acetyltransferase n=1 Tax=Kiloniella sp. GXU_MW_B19 TaxID=3141326 RepID=UPI0031E3917D